MGALRTALRGMDRARRAAAAEDEEAMGPGIRMFRRARLGRHAARLGLVSCPGAGPAQAG